jgi:hypothetical protein
VKQGTSEIEGTAQTVRSSRGDDVELYWGSRVAKCGSDGSLTVLLGVYRGCAADDPVQPMTHFLLVKSLKNTFLKAIYFNNYKRLNLLLYI